MENLKKTAIITDSSSGILQNEIVDGLFVMPLPFCINGEQRKEGVDLNSQQFYTYLKENAEVSTSQPAVGDLMDFWSDVLKTYDEIVHIPISSGLSQSCATANIFSKEKEFSGKVFVADAGRVSGMLKEAVFGAVKMAKEGKSAQEIKDYLEETRGDYTSYIAVESVKYLRKGGRITAAAAAIGTLLNIKPILNVYTEKIDKYGVARNMKKAKEMIISAAREDVNNKFAQLEKDGEMALYVVHSNAYEEAKLFEEEAKAAFPDMEYRGIDELSFVISCHTGPGLLAIVCAKKMY